MARPKKDQNETWNQTQVENENQYQNLLDQLKEAENTAGEIVKTQIAAGGPIIRMRRIQGEIHKLIKEAKVYV